MITSEDRNQRFNNPHRLCSAVFSALPKKETISLSLSLSLYTVLISRFIYSSSSTHISGNGSPAILSYFLPFFGKSLKGLNFSECD
ncbi:hypothetical protein L6452_33917 [Arctium lappa]|uniref:Uncharacterized protein n=1 Tax=Arctium lappa TaxID=4217 RepID=A0ACB8YGR2_ARCLA|nr:hypothetical protein L6452_33917 [Arctium lappa]